MYDIIPSLKYIIIHYYVWLTIPVHGNGNGDGEADLFHGDGPLQDLQLIHIVAASPVQREIVSCRFG